MIVRRQRIIKHGDSKVVVIPYDLIKSDEATVAACRLMLVDPRGEISEKVLGRLLEELIEPALYGRVGGYVKKPKKEAVS
jgi:hypothetical protein